MSSLKAWKPQQGMKSEGRICLTSWDVLLLGSMPPWGHSTRWEQAEGEGQDIRSLSDKKRVSLLFGSCWLSQQLLITSNQLLITYNKRDRKTQINEIHR